MPSMVWRISSKLALDCARFFAVAEFSAANSTLRLDMAVQQKASVSTKAWAIKISNYASTTNYKPIEGAGNSWSNGNNSSQAGLIAGVLATNSAISSIVFTVTSVSPLPP